LVAPDSIELREPAYKPLLWFLGGTEVSGGGEWRVDAQPVVLEGRECVVVRSHPQGKAYWLANDESLNVLRYEIVSASKHCVLDVDYEFRDGIQFPAGWRYVCTASEGGA